MVFSRRRKTVLALAALAVILLLAGFPFAGNYLARSRELAKLRELHIATDRAQLHWQVPQDGPNSAADFQKAFRALDLTGLSSEDLSIIRAFGRAGGQVNQVKIKGGTLIDPLPKVKARIKNLEPALRLLESGANKTRCSFEGSNLLEPESEWAKPTLQMLDLLGARAAYSALIRNKPGALADLELLSDLTNQVETSSLDRLQSSSLGACAMQIVSHWPTDPEVVALAKQALTQNSGSNRSANQFNFAVIGSRELLWSASPEVGLLSQPDSFGWAYRSKLNRLMAEEKILRYWRELAESQRGFNSDAASTLLTKLDEDKTFSGELASQVVHAVRLRKRPADEIGMRDFFLVLLNEDKRLRDQAWNSGPGVRVIVDAQPFVPAPLQRQGATSSQRP